MPRILSNDPPAEHTMIDPFINAEVHAGAARCASRRAIISTDPDRAERENESAQGSRALWWRAVRQFQTTHQQSTP
jgi:hypothetical protein